MQMERFYRGSSRRRLSCLATAIDPSAQIARLGGGATLSYDRLVVTVG
jgi:NADH dehydrogenase FAD-containing subunit